MDAHHNIAYLDAESCGGLRGINIRHLLHFKVVIAGTERAHLVALAFFGLLGNLRRIGAVHAAALFDAKQIRLRAKAVLHRPACAAAQHRIHLGLAQANAAGAAEAGGDGVKQAVCQLQLHRVDVFNLQAGMQGAHAAGNIETHPARRHHAPLVASNAATPPMGKP